MIINDNNVHAERRAHECEGRAHITTQSPTSAGHSKLLCPTAESCTSVADKVDARSRGYAKVSRPSADTRPMTVARYPCIREALRAGPCCAEPLLSHGTIVGHDHVIAV